MSKGKVLTAEKQKITKLLSERMSISEISKEALQRSLNDNIEKQFIVGGSPTLSA